MSDQPKPRDRELTGAPAAATDPPAEEAFVAELMTEDKAQALIEEYDSEGGRAHALTGFWRYVAGAIAVGLSLYALYATRAIVPAQIYRTSFLGAALVLTFLLYPWRRRAAGRVSPFDLLLVGASIVVTAYPIWDYQEFVYRAARPTTLDVTMGAIAIMLILEATRRTIGWILPVVAIVLLGYGRWGYLLPGEYGHKGYDLDRTVGSLYVTLEGIFGVPLDVAATYIILFTIYGAALEFSGAGKFFLDFSFAAMGGR
ncbi:MAG: TRAP transporter large permease subunit, partial [Chloroflexia bacterium]|nr:TRAP transporter large permease subunit [Chloroflexia bacterium]